MKSEVFIEQLLKIEQKEPDRVFAKLLFRDQIEELLTYGELLSRSRQFAAMFSSRGIRQHELVISLLPFGSDVICSFVGASLIGAVPSIYAPPSPKIERAIYNKWLNQLIANSGTRAVVTDAELADTLRIVDTELTVFDAADADEPLETPSLPEIQAEDILLLQYSSGTTGLRKGVALSNRAVMNQLRNTADALRLTEDDRIASWAPLYHDLGLIANLLLPLAHRVPVTLMSPFDWVVRPAMLLDAITQSRATLCWMPNFAYNFLADRVPEKDASHIDLSSVRAFINVAEPIHASSHRAFLDRYESKGVNRNALCTCYALAENTFAVTQGGIDQPVRYEEVDWREFAQQQQAIAPSVNTLVRRTLVSSGVAINNNYVKIVNSKRLPHPDRHVGEIAVHSDSLMSGYYDRPGLTEEVLENGWYYTGDAGFICNGHLFVTGRLTDMIIVAGKNIYPQDIEEVVFSIEGIIPGRAVSFGLQEPAKGTEEVVVLAETTLPETEHTTLKLAIAQRVKAELECIANRIELLPHMWLIKSSSGKLSRSACRKKYLEEFQAEPD